jgi:alkylation response protein AidB-like acyl-CoA dehydrogenase
VNLELSESDLAFREEARAWLREYVPSGSLPSMDTRLGFERHREWEAQLAESRWSVVSWPEEYSGRSASLLQWVIFEEEYYRAGAPARVSQNGIFLLAPIIFEHGSAEQRDRFLPSMARGDEIWAQAWSEPESGSDLASIKGTATRDDVREGWVLNGQKTWSSRATFADRGFGLFRSDASAARHEGLTYFLFPLDAAGVTVRPIDQLDGEPGFAEIFFDDVFVPDSEVVGRPGDGWRVAMSTAGNERGLSLRSPGRFIATVDKLIQLSVEHGADDPSSRVGVVDAWIAAQAYRLYTFGTVTRLEAGHEIGAAGSINKLFWSELDIAIHETALSVLGAESELRGAGAAAMGAWIDGYLFSLAGPIYAGTNEIQRNIVAERLLGLPRGSR